MGKCTKVRYSSSIKEAKALKEFAEKEQERAFRSTPLTLTDDQFDDMANLLDDRKNLAALDFNGEKMIAHSSVSDIHNLYASFFELVTENRAPFLDIHVTAAKDINTSNSWKRHRDAEAKILIYLAKNKLTMNDSGTIYLYTKFEPCLGCDYYFVQFMNIFKNIDLVIYWELPYPNPKEAEEFEKKKLNKIIIHNINK